MGNLIIITFGNHFGMIMIARHCVLQYTEGESIQKGVLCGCPFHKDHICACSSLSVMNDMEGFRRKDEQREKCKKKKTGELLKKAG